MAWLRPCVFLLFTFFLQQALGATVVCLWKQYFHIGHDVSGACQVKPPVPGCGGQSLRLVAAGVVVQSHSHTGDSAHFTVPAPAEGTLHLRCEVTCTGLNPLSYCDITLQGGYPPSSVPGPKCHIPLDGIDLDCTWDPLHQSLLPTNYTLHWENHWETKARKEEVDHKQKFVGANTSGIIFRDEFIPGEISVWITAQNSLGSVRSEEVSFDTIDVVEPHAPTITHHSVLPLEIFWDFECDEAVMFTNVSDRSCEVQYRMQNEKTWTEGDGDAQDHFLLPNLQPFCAYEFRVRCACSMAVRSAWSHTYLAQSSEAAPDGQLDVWSDCNDESYGKSECAIVWRKPPCSVARGEVLGYMVMVERDSGDPTVMNISSEELGPREQREYRAQNMKELCGDCHRLHLSLQGTTGVYLMAYTSQGATDPAPVALPTPCPKLLLSTDFAVVREGRSLNVSWAPLSHLTEDFQYVVQWKEVGFHATQNFDWINVNRTQRTIIVKGDFRNSTPYNISLFSVATNYRCLLGSTITYILEEVPPEVPGLYISEISSFSVIVTWEHIPLNESRGVIHHYHIGLTNHTEKIVSGDTNSLLFLGLSPSQEYQVWICAESEAGWGPTKYLSFITARTGADYIIYIVVAMVTVLFLVVILLLFCCSQARVEYLKQLGGCWGKVPDPTNSRLFQQVKSNSGWPGFFSLEESTQRLSQLEVVEVQVPEEDGLPEISPPPEEHNEGWARLGQTQTEVESDKQEEVEKEWTKTIKKGGSEISSEGENYSKMIDTEGGEEDMSWSPTETQDFFSGYEKHFMPSPLEV